MIARGPLRAAVVGAGLMGRWHADAIFHAGGRVTAVVDQDSDRAAILARRCRGARVVAWSEVLTRQIADVVHVCTADDSHASLAAQALRAGMHALVEKPLASDAMGTAELLGLAESEGRILCPVHQFLFQPGILRAQQELPAIGRLLYADVVLCSAGANGSPEAERGRITANILPHPLSLIARLTDAPVGTAQWQVQNSTPGEVQAWANVGGVSCSLLVSLQGRPTRSSLRLVGSRGTLHADLFHGFRVSEHGATSRMRKVMGPFNLAGATIWEAATNLVARAARLEVAFPGLRELVRRFYAAARDEADWPIHASETLDVARARDTLVSAMQRREEALGADVPMLSQMSTMGSQ